MTYSKEKYDQFVINIIEKNSSLYRYIDTSDHIQYKHRNKLVQDWIFGDYGKHALHNKRNSAKLAVSRAKKIIGLSNHIDWKVSQLFYLEVDDDHNITDEKLAGEKFHSPFLSDYIFPNNKYFSYINKKFSEDTDQREYSEDDEFQKILNYELNHSNGFFDQKNKKVDLEHTFSNLLYHRRIPVLGKYHSFNSNWNLYIRDILNFIELVLSKKPYDLDTISDIDKLKDFIGKINNKYVRNSKQEFFVEKETYKKLSYVYYYIILPDLIKYSKLTDSSNFSNSNDKSDLYIVGWDPSRTYMDDEDVKYLHHLIDLYESIISCAVDVNIKQKSRVNFLYSNFKSNRTKYTGEYITNSTISYSNYDYGSDNNNAHYIQHIFENSGSYKSFSEKLDFIKIFEGNSEYMDFLYGHSDNYNILDAIIYYYQNEEHIISFNKLLENMKIIFQEEDSLCQLGSNTSNKKLAKEISGFLKIIENHYKYTKRSIILLYQFFGEFISESILYISNGYSDIKEGRSFNYGEDGYFNFERISNYLKLLTIMIIVSPNLPAIDNYSMLLIDNLNKQINFYMTNQFKLFKIKGLSLKTVNNSMIDYAINCSKNPRVNLTNHEDHSKTLNSLKLFSNIDTDKLNLAITQLKYEL